MKLDPQNADWKPAHDREMRLRSPWALAIALALIALTSAALIGAPTGEQEPRPTVARVLP